MGNPGWVELLIGCHKLKYPGNQERFCKSDLSNYICVTICMTKSLHMVEDQKAPKLSIEELCKELEEADILLAHVSQSARSGHPYTIGGVLNTGSYLMERVLDIGKLTPG